MLAAVQANVDCGSYISVSLQSGWRKDVKSGYWENVWKLNVRDVAETVMLADIGGGEGKSEEGEEFAMSVCLSACTSHLG